MGTKIVIGDPPLGPQIQEVLIGRMESGNVVVQTDNGWVTIPEKLAEEVGRAIIKCSEECG